MDKIVNSIRDKIIDSDLSLVEISALCTNSKGNIIESFCTDSDFWFRLAEVRQPGLIDLLLLDPEQPTSEDIGNYISRLSDFMLLTSLYLPTYGRYRLNRMIIHKMPDITLDFLTEKGINLGITEANELFDPDATGIGLEEEYPLIDVTIDVVQLKNGGYAINGISTHSMLVNDVAITNTNSSEIKGYFKTLDDLLQVLGVLIYISTGRGIETLDPENIMQHNKLL